jgi:hypothetical protein
MLLGGKGGCQQCTCVPCDPCERTCTNPHTGTAFEAVYTRYFEGAEDGNVSDGYLTASGDSDTSDPYDSMDGNGPWFQQVAGEFTLEPSTTRHPCNVTVSFWRNNNTLGASTIPPPATTTTMNRIRVSVSASSGTGVFVEGTLVGVGETLDLAATIPLVTGGGDQSTNDPRTYNGSATVTPECHNKTAIFTIEARLEWSVKKRQHVVYGLVRECYEEGTPCSGTCSGSPPPESLYLTISNAAVTSGSFVGTFPVGTYVMNRIPTFCNAYVNRATGNCSLGPGYWADFQGVNVGFILNTGNLTFDIASLNNGVCGDIHFDAVDSRLLAPCGTGELASGSASWSWFQPSLPFAYGTLDWKVEA